MQLSFNLFIYYRTIVAVTFFSFDHPLIMFICQTCSSSFTTKSEYYTHRRACTADVETFIYKATNQKITVQKNSKGLFECYCSDKGCPGVKKAYKSTENLKRHMTKVKSHWIGPSKAGDSSAYMYTKLTTLFKTRNQQLEKIVVMKKTIRQVTY